MSNLPEQIELLQAERRHCIDRAERLQIRAELEAAIERVASEERCDAMTATPEDPRPG